MSTPRTAPSPGHGTDGDESAQLAWRVAAPVVRRGWLEPGGAAASARDGDGPWCSDTGGALPVVVLVHGIGASSRYFTRLHSHLARDHRVLVPDLPGYGRSQHRRTAEDASGHATSVLRLLDQLGLADVVLVGHSRGAQVVTEMAIRRPAAARAVVLLCPVPEPSGARAARHLLRLARDARHERAALNLLLTRDILRAGLRHYAADLPGMLSYPLVERLAMVRAPVRLVRGANDPICTTRLLDLLGAGTPGRWAVEVADAGHVVMDRAPGAVAEVCRSW